MHFSRIQSAARRLFPLIAFCIGLPVTLSAQELHSRPAKFLDEVRVGISGSIQRSNTFEKGAFPSFMLLFDPLDRANAVTWTDVLLRPRVHAGAIVSTAGETSQIYGGFTWTADVTERTFLDFGFGGSWNNANITDASRGPYLGCNLLFRESLAAGYKITENLRIMATVEHSSNADLCDINDGLTYAGVSVGYKF